MPRLIRSNNKIEKFECGEVRQKTKWQASTSEHIAEVGTDSNTIFRWSDDLVEDLLKALSNFKTVMEFWNKDSNADNPRQYDEVRKEIVKINERYVKYFGPVSLPLFPSDMDDEEEIGFLSKRKLDFYLNGCFTHTSLFFR